jgi:H+-translocating NAD(P) transhydrogenase subunit alpha
VPGETVERSAVVIIAPLHISSELAFHASHMYAKNVTAFVTLLTKDSKLNLDFADDIISAVCVTAGGEVRNPAILQRLSQATT